VRISRVPGKRTDFNPEHPHRQHRSISPNRDPGSNANAASATQSLKQQPPIDRTDFGMQIEASLEQPEKTECPISASFESEANVTLANEVQS
jgi:hypothetical protein